MDKKFLEQVNWGLKSLSFAHKDFGWGHGYPYFEPLSKEAKKLLKRRFFNKSKYVEDAKDLFSRAWILYGENNHTKHEYYLTILDFFNKKLNDKLSGPKNVALIKKVKEVVNDINALAQKHNDEKIATSKYYTELEELLGRHAVVNAKLELFRENILNELNSKKNISVHVDTDRSMHTGFSDFGSFLSNVGLVVSSSYRIKGDIYFDNYVLAFTDVTKLYADKKDETIKRVTEISRLYNETSTLYKKLRDNKFTINEVDQEALDKFNKLPTLIREALRGAPIIKKAPYYLKEKDEVQKELHNMITGGNQR